MTLPIEFPDPQAKARRRAEEFQRLSPDARWREMAALMALGWAMVQSSPDPLAAQRRMDDQELQWQRIQRELFLHHAK